MRDRKILNFLVIVLNIFFIASAILLLLFRTDSYKELFWVATALLLCGILVDINDWSKIGLDLDKHKSMTIKRAFNDNTTLLVVFYASLLMLLKLFDIFDGNLMKNNSIIIIMFIMTLEFELFTYLSVTSAKKDTIRLLKGSK